MAKNSQGVNPGWPVFILLMVGTIIAGLIGLILSGPPRAKRDGPEVWDRGEQICTEDQTMLGAGPNGSVRIFRCVNKSETK